MRSLLVSMLAATAVAQSPLSTTFANNNGGASGGAVYFELESLDPAGVTITDLDLNVGGAGGVAANFDLYLQPLNAAGELDHDGTWVGPVSSGSTAATQAAGTPTNFALSTPLALGAGCRYGVAIAGDFAHAYTTGSGGFQLNYQTAELEILACCASNTPFAGSAFTPRVVNTSVYYTSGGTCPSIASCAPSGDGCLASLGSFYEAMSPANFDLNGMILTGTSNGSGFDISVAAGAGISVPAGATEIAGLGDDTSVDTNGFGGTLGLWAGSNCWLSTGTGNSNGFSPSVSVLLNNPETGVYSWTDLQPNAAGSGQVYYDEPAAGVGRLTYDGVYGWSTTDPNYIQITLDTNTGDFSIEWGVTGASNPEDFLVGYSPGGPSDDPSAIDISAGAFSIGDGDAPALSLDCVGRPIQDPDDAVDFEATTSNIGENTFAHVGMIGFPLTTPMNLEILGFPSACTAYVLGVPRVQIYPPMGPTGAPSDETWTALTIPPQAAGVFSGLEFSLQAYTFELSFTNATSRASNAVDCVIGTL